MNPFTSIDDPFGAFNVMAASGMGWIGSFFRTGWRSIKGNVFHGTSLSDTRNIISFNTSTYMNAVTWTSKYKWQWRMTRKRTCKPFFMFIIIMHTVMMRMRTIFDVHRHGRGTYMNRRMYFMLITYQVLAYCVLLLVRDVRGDLRDTRQLTTSQINNQQTVHASYMGKIHLYQYIFYVVHSLVYYGHGEIKRLRRHTPSFVAPLATQLHIIRHNVGQVWHTVGQLLYGYPVWLPNRVRD